jgi:signal transduction histidine kinase
LNEAQQEFSIRALEKNVTIQINSNLSIQVVGEKLKICQIIVNLVNNAIDAAAETNEKWVRIELQALPQSARLCVTDSGQGIPEEIRPKLFQQLFTTKGNEGSGLGLNIVKKFTEELGGTIVYNAESLNTQFILNLPIIL